MNLAINKRHSLAHLADGWTDDCFLLVRAASVSDVKEWQTMELDKLTDADAVEQLVTLLEGRILSGAVMDSASDGSTRLVKVEKTEVKEVLEQLPVSELRGILSTCLGLAELPSQS